MAIDDNELRKHREDSARIYGKAFLHFLCPILLEDSVGPFGLMDGHILPLSVKKAARKTVIQRADVDNFFGSRLETALVHFVNAPHYSFEEFAKHSEIRAVTPDETKLMARTFSGKSNPPFQKFEIPNPDDSGGLLAHVFVKEDLPDPLPKMDFDFTIVANKSLIVGSLLKAAYLMMFHLLGYEYVNTCAGNSVRSKLAAFFNEGADISTAPKYFHEFNNCYRIVTNELFENDNNTITSQRLLFHLAPGEVPGDLFAVSCLFKLNDMCFVVMIPFCSKPEHVNYLPAFLRYRRQLLHPETPQAICVGRLTSNGFEACSI